MSFNYREALPLHGHVFPASSGRWEAHVIDGPEMQADRNRVAYRIVFQSGSRTRVLRLSIEDSEIRNDRDHRYQRAIFDSITQWLSLESGDGELEVLFG